jgi:hypothetical protein
MQQAELAAAHAEREGAQRALAAAEARATEKAAALGAAAALREEQEARRMLHERCGALTQGLDSAAAVRAQLEAEVKRLQVCWTSCALAFACMQHGVTSLRCLLMTVCRPPASTRHLC